jgi:predicted acyltransferase
MLGVRAGDWLRRGEVRRLLQAGVAALAIGGLWSLAFPLNKNLWSSSYVLWTGGWALLAAALLHELIDRRGWPAIGRRFGVNAIAVYAGAWLMECALDALRWKEPLYAGGFGWVEARFGASGASLAYAIAFVALWWVVAAVLDRRRIYVKI